MKTPDAPADAPAPNPNEKTVTFASPIERGAQRIAAVVLRRPRPGALRGTKLSDLLQMDVVAVAKVVARISTPSVTEAEILNMEDPGDFTDLASAISDFLLPTRMREDSPTTATS